MGERSATVTTVEVAKRPGQGVGLYLREGDGEGRDRGVFVSRLVPGSVADLSGSLAVGDEILTVNGVDVARRRLEDVVVSMSIPKRLVLGVRRSSGQGRSLAAAAAAADARPYPVVIIKRGSSAYTDRPRSYCSPSSSGSIRLARSPERVSPAGGGGRVRYPRSVSVDFRRVDDRQEDAFDHLNAIVTDDSGDSGLSSDNSGLSRLTLEPVNEVGVMAAQKPSSCYPSANFATSLLMVKSNTSSPLFSRRTASLRSSACRRSGEWSGTLSDSDVMYAKNPNWELVNQRMAGDDGMNYDSFPKRTTTLSYQPAEKHPQNADFYTARRSRASSAYGASKEVGRNAWYSDCNLPETDVCHQQYFLSDSHISVTGLLGYDSNSPSRQPRLSGPRSLNPHESRGKPSMDISEDLNLADSLATSVYDSRKLNSLISSWNCRNPQKVPGRSFCGSGQEFCHFPGNRNPGCCDAEDRRPLQIRKEAFRKFQHPNNPKTQSCDDCGIDGLLSVHVFCAHELASPFLDSRAVRVCVLDVDGLTHAKTSAFSSGRNFDWDEEFDVYLQNAKVITFTVLRADEQVRLNEPHFAISAEVKRLFAKEKNQRLCFNLKPFGELYVELVYTPPQKVFTRIPSVHAQAVFGTDLGSVVTSSGVPSLVFRCVQEVELRGLDRVGIYCISGSRRSIHMVRECLERNVDMADLSEGAVKDINVITGVLKEFLRELPEPMCTNALHEMFFDALLVQVPQDAEGNAHLMLSVVDCLPKPYLDTLTFLLDHLRRVLMFSSKNKMTIRDLSACLGPLMFCPTQQRLESSKVMQSKASCFKNHSKLLRYLLEIWMTK